MVHTLTAEAMALNSSKQQAASSKHQVHNDVTQLLPLPDKIAAVTGKHRGGCSRAAPCSGSRCDAPASSVNLP